MPFASHPGKLETGRFLSFVRRPLMIKTPSFDKLCHEILDDSLAQHGFSWRGDGVYVRAAPDGRDQIGLDFRPSREKFCVMVTHYPSSFWVIEELHPELGGQINGFLCKPYLNPKGTSWNPSWLKARDKESATSSLQQVLSWIEQAGLAWLVALRNPQIYAESSDPVAAIGSGFAHEIAGNLEIARQRYSEMNRRFEMIEKDYGLRKDQACWRDFLFVRGKLGIEDSLTVDIRTLAGWDPKTTPLPKVHR